MRCDIWKITKGNADDFTDCNPIDATHKYISNEKGHYVFTRHPGIIRHDLFTLVASRELIEQKSVTVDISTPCGEDDLNDCIGSTESLIAERGARYGKFKDGAEIMRDLKHVMHEVDGWNNLTPSQKEALDMIQHKIGRILNGDPNYEDNWKDIAGYAKLIADELNGDIK